MGQMLTSYIFAVHGQIATKYAESNLVVSSIPHIKFVRGGGSCNLAAIIVLFLRSMGVLYIMLYVKDCAVCLHLFKSVNYYLCAAVFQYNLTYTYSAPEVTRIHY